MAGRRISKASLTGGELGRLLLIAALILGAIRLLSELIGVGQPPLGGLEVAVMALAGVGALLVAVTGTPPADDGPSRLGLLAASAGTVLLLAASGLAGLFPADHLGFWIAVGLFYVGITPVLFGLAGTGLRMLARRRVRRLAAALAGAVLVAAATGTGWTSISGLPASLVVGLVALALPTHRGLPPAPLPDGLPRATMTAVATDAQATTAKVAH